LNNNQWLVEVAEIKLDGSAVLATPFRQHSEETALLCIAFIHKYITVIIKVAK
jgi:hypothetical protein